MHRVCFLLLGLLASPAMAGGLTLSGPITQGGLVIGHGQAGSRASLDGRALRVADNGVFVFGFGRDARADHQLVITAPDGRIKRRQLKVTPRQYRIERIDGLPPKMVTPPPEVLARIRRENALIAKVRATDSPAQWFAGGFIRPAPGPLTGFYGSRRILNGHPRRPHFGLDMAPPEGTPVVAPAGGRIALAKTGLYYTGGTVMIDHGQGITSVLMHLKEVRVKAGQAVKQGDVIGTVGATGRATGPHVDWRVNWFEVRLDPALLLK